MPTGARQDPNLIAFFKVEIDGMTDLSFRKCAGLKSETEIFEYREGGLNDAVHKLAGPTRANNIVLTQGHISDPAMRKWYDEVGTAHGDKIKRRNGAIVACAADRSEVDRWNFVGAYPVRWETSDFDALSNDVLCETLELAVQKIVHSK
jgi:phage tail-like protein